MNPDPERDPRPVERRLQSLEYEAPPEGLKAAVFAGAPAGRRWSLPVLVMLAAACALIGFAVWRGGSARHETETETQKNRPVDVATAAGSFEVVKTRPDRNDVLVQDYDRFHVDWKRPGDALGEYRLVAVRESELDLSGELGAETQAIDSLNERARRALAKECADLAAAFQHGSLSPAQIERVDRIACFGIAEAVALAGRVRAASPGGAVGKLARLAREGSEGERLSSVRALAELNDPVALQCIREIACGAEQGPALLAVQELAKREGGYVFEALRRIAASANLPEARAAAELALSKRIAGKEKLHADGR